MSHADTIRIVLDWPMAYYNEEQEQLARKALDALLVENQRLGLIVSAAKLASDSYAHPMNPLAGSDIDYYMAQLREALAGDAE